MRICLLRYSKIKRIVFEIMSVCRLFSDDCAVLCKPTVWTTYGEVFFIWLVTQSLRVTSCLEIFSNDIDDILLNCSLRRPKHYVLTEIFPNVPVRELSEKYKTQSAVVPCYMKDVNSPKSALPISFVF